MSIEVEIKIESGIPCPARQTGISGALRTLEVGQSFTLPAKHRGSAQSMASHLGKATSRKFALRRINETTIRIWRTA